MAEEFPKEKGFPQGGGGLSEDYPGRVRRHTPATPLWKNLRGAFFIGGAICALAECLAQGFLRAGLDPRRAYALTTVCMILLSALLTGIGVYDRIARAGGAGTLVPVTGFANAVVSPAIDNKSEGLIVGVGAKIFAVAGPVILFSVLAGTLYGILYFLFAGV